ncbi:MAG: hypothetical protein K6A44_07050 [bacterium]|nr:hypothetical protein [bacterium]
MNRMRTVGENHGFCGRVSANGTKLEFVRAKVCGNEVKQTTCPRGSKIQDASAPDNKKPPKGGFLLLINI